MFGFTDDVEETLEQAVEMGREAVQLDGNDSEAHMIYGRILAEVGQHENAIAELHRALRLDPNNAWGYFYLGYALYWSGRAAEALPHLMNSLRLTPRDPFRGFIEALIGSTHSTSGDHAAPR